MAFNVSDTHMPGSAMSVFDNNQAGMKEWMV